MIIYLEGLWGWGAPPAGPGSGLGSGLLGMALPNGGDCTGVCIGCPTEFGVFLLAIAAHENGFGSAE